MNIGFDLDRIFINYPPFMPAKFIDRLYKKRSNGILAYRIPSRFEQFIRIISHFSIFRPPIQENIKILKKITQKNNNKHFLISSRFGFLQKRTSAIIKKYEIDKVFDELSFNFDNKQPHVFKDETIKKHKINLYIDDDLPLLKYLANKNPQTKFFWLNNKQKGKLAKNLFSITNLKHIFQ